MRPGGSSSVGRAAAFQAACREFEPRLPLHFARARPAWVVGDGSAHVGYRPAVSDPSASDPAPVAGDVGRLLGGRYRLQAIIGRGGMATIYRARDERLETLVAVKVLRREIAADRELAERFRREALAAAVLNHPNIVACLDTGADPVGPYLVMALVDGEDLTTRLRRETVLPPADVARIGLDVARALGCAHARGIVHRDVKPGNILLANDGRALVTDFGIALLADDAEGATSGTILGSVQYFSPEQARGVVTTPASDVYGLGLVLYEALTGLRPWSGETSAAIALARIGAPAPSPRASRRDVPVALDAVVVRALDPDPAHRYPDGIAMAAALERLLVAPPPGHQASATQPVGTAGPPVNAVGPAPARSAAQPADPSDPRPARRSRRPGPVVLILALAGVLLGAVVVAALPDIGNGNSGPAALASRRPSPTAIASRAPAPTKRPTAAPTKAPVPDPTPLPTAPPAAALDLCEPFFGFPCGQDPGRYGPSRFVPAVTFPLGSGWSTELHTTDRVSLVRNEGRLTLLGDTTRIYPKGSEEAVKGTLRKIVGRIASTAGTASSKVRALTIDGHPGYSVDLTTKGRQALPILGVGEETFFLEPFATTRFVFLDVGKRTLALMIEPTGGSSLKDILATADDVAVSLRTR